MIFDIEVVKNMEYCRIQNENIHKLADNLNKGESLNIYCNFYTSHLAENNHIITYLDCGDTRIQGALKLNGFESLEFELTNIHLKPFIVHSFILNKTQSVNKYPDYIKKLLENIQEKYNIELPSEVQIITNNEVLYDLF